MKTLVIFTPETSRCPCKTVKNIPVSNKTLRIIYFKENMTKPNLFMFKLKMKKHLKNCKILSTAFAQNFKQEKLYQSGKSLLLFHIDKIINIISPQKPVVVFSNNVADIHSLSGLIMTCKDIKFLTSEENITAFTETLLSEFGISGGAFTDCSLSGETVVIMPGGNIFTPEGAGKILNLSNDTMWKSILPQNISYCVPHSLKVVPSRFRCGDMLETVLDFFEIDYSFAKPISLIFNK